MSHPDILAALAHERRQGLLAQAESARLARQVRPARGGNRPPALSRSPLRRSLSWLASLGSRLLSWRSGSPGSGYGGRREGTPDATIHGRA